MIKSSSDTFKTVSLAVLNMHILDYNHTFELAEGHNQITEKNLYCKINLIRRNF